MIPTNKFILIGLFSFAGIGVGFVLYLIFYHVDKMRESKVLKEHRERKHLIIDISNEAVARLQALDWENCKPSEKDDKYENIIDNYIINCFSEHSGVMSGLNNVKVNTGIFTNDADSAEFKIMEIYNSTPKNMVHQLKNSRDIKELRLVNGSRYIWIKPSNNSKGYRCSNAIIDRRVTLEELHNHILPICVYCGKDNVNVF